jgi:hypothetical protein
MRERKLKVSFGAPKAAASIYWQRTAMLALLAFALLLCSATPAEDMAGAKKDIAADHVYSADALLQKIIVSPDATPAQVQEALYLQTMIYYGDVFGAALLIGPVAGGSGGKDSKLGQETSRQLLLARRAFHAASVRLLNEFNAGRKLESVKVDLPTFGEGDIDKLNEAIGSKNTMEALVSGFASDESAGRGMLAKANHFGLYIGFSSLLAKQKNRKMSDIESKVKGGIKFDEARYLDWLATVCLDMRSLIKNEPSAPDLSGLAKRADERLKKLVKDKEDPLYKNAAKRAKSY